MRRGGLVVALAAFGVLAIADSGGGKAEAGNPNCGNPAIDYGPWLGPYGGREHEQMFAKFAMSEQNSTCKHTAVAIVNCPPAEHDAPA